MRLRLAHTVCGACAVSEADCARQNWGILHGSTDVENILGLFLTELWPSVHFNFGNSAVSCLQPRARRRHLALALHLQR